MGEPTDAVVRGAYARLVKQQAAELAATRTERDAWKELAEARNALMAYYRGGRRPSEKALRRLDSARSAVDALTEEDG